MIRYLIVFAIGYAVGHATPAAAQSATSIIQQYSRVESSPCGYASVADWWRSILTCRAVDAQGRVYYYRVRAR